ncbi:MULTISPECIES: hypothetical protein [unclassified Allomuricauda]|uniref:hypothetical protein n=1 Tax=unclassified Allomuricauda TaxID=2615049 RepID=UPI00273EEB5E|nr:MULTISPECIES: hypothetical protein [unclassified Allomuricauda]
MENRQLHLCLSLLAVLLAMACKPKTFDTKEDLYGYLKNPDNGYHLQKSVNGIDYALTYRPTDLVVSQFMDKDVDTERVDQLRKQYSDYLYFNLGISANGKELLTQKVQNRSEYGAMVNQLAFGMAEKITLTNDTRDTLQLLDYSYPRMYGMGSSTELLLVYRNSTDVSTGEHLYLSIKDLGFGTGEVTFKLATENIKKQPQLKF